MTDRKSVWPFFWIVLRMGTFTFGGGYAMLPIMQRDYVDKRSWLSQEDMADILAVAQSVPGIVSVNATIMVGYRVFGVKGAILGGAGLLLPSLLIISVITGYYHEFQSNRVIQAALSGIRVGVVALLIQALLNLARISLPNKSAWILCMAALTLSLLTTIHPILLILAGGVIGMVRALLLRENKKGDTV